MFKIRGASFAQSSERAPVERSAVGPSLQETGYAAGDVAPSKDAAAAFSSECWPLGGVPQDVRDRWLALLAPSDGPCPVLQAPGSLAVAAGIDPKIAIRVLAVRDATGEVIGIQPVRHGALPVDFNTKHNTLFRIAFNGVSLIGTEPLVANVEQKPAVLRSVLHHLRNARAIEFNELKQADVIEREVASFAAADRHVFRAGGRGDWSYSHVPQSMEIYNSGLGKKKLYNLRRQDRMLVEHLGGELEFVVVRDGADLGLLVEAMRQLTGWPPAKLRWAEKDAELSCREGIACFFVLKSKDKLVGLVRATAWGGQLHVHSMHRNFALEKFSPGTALWQTVLKWLIDGGEFHRIIFAYGATAHGKRATDVTEHRSHVFVFRKSLRASSVMVLYRVFDASKSRLKVVMSAARTKFGPAPVAAPVIC